MEEIVHEVMEKLSWPGDRRVRVLLESCWVWLRDDSASSLVEAALVLPIFLLLVLGAGEFGLLAYDSIEVTDAAYAGASYAAQNHATASDTANISAAAAADRSNLSNLVTSVSNTCVCSNGNTITCSNAGADCVAPARIVEYVQINTSAAVNPAFGLPGFPNLFTLHGQAVLRVEQ